MIVHSSQWRTRSTFSNFSARPIIGHYRSPAQACDRWDHDLLKVDAALRAQASEPPRQTLHGEAAFALRRGAVIMVPRVLSDFELVRFKGRE
jgi:hypothetical protein